MVKLQAGLIVPSTPPGYIVFDTTNRWVVVSPTDPRNESIEQIIDSTLSVRDYRFDNVFPNSANVVENIVWEEGSLNSGTGTYKPGSTIIVNGGGEVEESGSYRSGFCNSYAGIKYKVTGGDVVAFMYTIGNSFLGSVSVNNNGTFITSPNTRHIRFVTQSADYANIVCGAVNSDTSFIVNEEAYNIIGSLQETITGFPTIERSGREKGITPMIEQFVQLSDDAYITSKNAVDDAQADIKDLDEDLIDALGDMYREGYWQKSDYVDGDEDKLYNDAIENLVKIAKPDAKYSISYLDLYGENESDFEYGASDIAVQTAWPDINPDYAAHLIDQEIGISQWAFIDTCAKCYDQPWKTQITINTNLSTIAQHSFTDVLTHIANVASQVNSKMDIYERAKQFDQDGRTQTSNLEGRIDANRLMLTGGSSTWYTDDEGNMVFESADGKSAMTLTGNGFCIANSKNQYGEWNWRTFGTGEGFVADLITAGTLEADRVISNTLLARLGETLRIVANHVIIDSGNDTSKSLLEYVDSSINEVDMSLSADIDTIRTEADYSIATAKNDLTSLIDLRVSQTQSREELIRASVSELKLSNDAIVESVRSHDAQLGNIGTHVIVDAQNGLTLRQDQNANYEAVLSSDELKFKQKGDQGSTVATFGVTGSYVDKLHSNKTLSVGSEDKGWFDMTQTDSGSVVDKWRNGTNSQTPSVIITQQPVNSIGTSFSFSVQAENATNYQWQKRERYDGIDANDNPWVNIANATSSTYTQQLSQQAVQYEYRCHVYNSESSLYSRAVCAFDSLGPKVIADLPKNIVDVNGSTAVLTVLATGNPTYTWYQKTNDTWSQIAGLGSSISITVSGTTYYRCDLDDNSQYASTRVCKVVSE